MCGLKPRSFFPTSLLFTILPRQPPTSPLLSSKTLPSCKKNTSSVMGKAIKAQWIITRTEKTGKKHCLAWRHRTTWWYGWSAWPTGHRQMVLTRRSHWNRCVACVIALQLPEGKSFKNTVGDLYVVDAVKISSPCVHYCRNARGGLGRASRGHFVDLQGYCNSNWNHWPRDWRCFGGRYKMVKWYQHFATIDRVPMRKLK